MEVQEVNQTQVSHMVQVRTEDPEVPEAARPFRACGAKLAKLQLINNYLKNQNTTFLPLWM